jgi:hypothetical protein
MGCTIGELSMMVRMGGTGNTSKPSTSYLGQLSTAQNDKKDGIGNTSKPSTSYLMSLSTVNQEKTDGT